MKNLASLLPPPLPPPPPPLLLATNLIRTFARQKFTSVNLAALSLLIKQINVPVLSYTTLIIRIHYPIYPTIDIPNRETSQATSQLHVFTNRNT